MVSREPVLLAVAADARELAGFTRREPADVGTRWGYWSQWTGGKALMVAEGIGQEAAKRAVTQALVRNNVSAFISIGYVGSLRPGWQVGDVFLAKETLLLGDTKCYPVNLPVYDDGPGSVRRGRLLTIDHIAGTVEQKRRLAASGADAVDMEAYAVAERAAELGLPFFCVRVVSDDAETDLGFDFERARRGDGSVSGLAVAAQAGLSPKRWRRLMELKRQAELASRNLAHFLEQCRFPVESRP